MPEWPELQSHLRATYAVVRDDPEAIALSWSLTADDRELVQGVGLAPMMVGQRPWLTMVADLFPELVLPPRTALLYQDRLPFGALVLRSGAFLLRHGLPLVDLSLHELDWTIRVLVHEAARLRLNAERFAIGSNPFGNYSE